MKMKLLKKFISVLHFYHVLLILTFVFNFFNGSFSPRLVFFVILISFFFFFNFIFVLDFVLIFICTYFSFCFYLFYYFFSFIEFFTIAAMGHHRDPLVLLFQRIVPT